MDPVVVTARAPFDWNDFWWLRSGFFDTSSKGNPNDDFSRMEAAMRNAQRMADINTLFFAVLLAQQTVFPLSDFVPGLTFVREGDMAWAAGRYGNALLNYTASLVDVGLTVGTGGAAAAAKGAGSGLVKGGTKVGAKSLGAAAKGGTKAVTAIPKGFKQTKQFGYQHGQKVYEYKGKFYSLDIDAHNGGVWKVFEQQNGRLHRIGTADEYLNIFKH
jgi:hypothetical protein